MTNLRLPSNKKENLIDLSCDTSLKQNFQKASIIQFWLDIKNEYDILMNMILMKSYFYETGFSATAEMKFLWCLFDCRR